MHLKDNHLVHYFVLLVGFGVFLALFLLFRYDVLIRNLLIVSVCGFYSLWGIIHHKLEGRLSKLVLIEYIALSLFACVLMLTGANL